jgi:microcystin-dependent protein
MNPFLGEIQIFAGNFAPKGWELCQGQILPISQYTALFSLLGTTYGGNGTSNFALPNLQGIVPIHAGQSAGSGLTQRALGETAGVENVTLIQSQMPQHTHSLNGTATTGDSNIPQNNIFGKNAGGVNNYKGSSNATMNAGAVSPVGSSNAHNNLQPYLVLNFCIAMQGIFPSRG